MSINSDFSKNNFLSHFSSIEDPRIDRKKLYPLNEIFLVTICGVICGAEGWHDLSLFGKCKIDYLKSILPFANGVATDDTFRRVYAAIDPESFKTSFINWVKSLNNKDPEFIAVDGKTLRRSYDNSENKNAIHMVSAWCSEQGLVLGQLKTEEKSNEITAIPKLLDLLEIKKSIVTIDAMGCQKKIANKIIDKEADYILAVKDNQPTLHKEISKFFDYHKNLGYQGKGYNFYQYNDLNKDHGRIENRRYIATDQVSFLGDFNKWKKLNSIIMVESERTINNKTSYERRYYISSLSSDINNIANAIRSHWGIENSLHWVLDVSFNEDQSRIRKKHSAQNMAIIRHIVLNMLKQTKQEIPKFKKQSIKGLRKAAGWDHQTMNQILNR